MKKLFSLGELYVSDFIKQDEDARADSGRIYRCS